MRDTIFIATGTGIAPFRSMLQWLLTDKSRHQGKQR
jgi:ferredoxin-NADP reductase